MSRNNSALGALRERMSVQWVVNNHTILDSLGAPGSHATKRAQYGQGPIGVQGYVGPTKTCFLTDMQGLENLERQLPCRKRRKARCTIDKALRCPWDRVPGGHTQSVWATHEGCSE